MCDPTYNNSNNNTREEDISAAITVIRIAAFFGRPSSVSYIYVYVYTFFYYFLRVSVRDSHITTAAKTTTTTAAAKTITATAATTLIARSGATRSVVGNGIFFSFFFHTLILLVLFTRVIPVHTPSRRAAVAKFTGGRICEFY